MFQPCTECEHDFCHQVKLIIMRGPRVVSLLLEKADILVLADHSLEAARRQYTLIGRLPSSSNSEAKSQNTS